MKRKVYKKSSTLHVGDEIKVDVSVYLFQEGKQWLAYCPVLELSSYGDSEEDAKNAFEDALEIFITETTANGSLEKALLKLGWILKQQPEPMYQPPAVNGEKMFKKNPANVYNELVSLPL
jgi:hypothetical protein